MTISEALQLLITNPDDLSTLPQLIAQVKTLEQSEFGYQERISKLQDINKNYLSQIPIAGNEPEKVEKVVPPTFEDAKNYLVETLGGNQ